MSPIFFIVLLLIIGVSFIIYGHCLPSPFDRPKIKTKPRPQMLPVGALIPKLKYHYPEQFGRTVEANRRRSGRFVTEFPKEYHQYWDKKKREKDSESGSFHG